MLEPSHIIHISSNNQSTLQSSYYAGEPGWSFVSFAMIGIVMTPLGDGLVIPGLSAFKPLNLGPMPQTMFTAAPLEVVVCLFAFGIVQVRQQHPLVSVFGT